MEDDDFGFTKREESVLKKVLSNNCASGENAAGTEEAVAEEVDDKNSSNEVNSSSAGAEGTGYGGSVIPEESEGVSRPDGGGNTRSGGGGTSPETGSEEANKRSSQGSVGPQTPNIPNVVEYHLKVKPGTGENARFQKHKQLTIKHEERKSTEMRTDCRTPLSSRSEKKSLSNKLAKLSIDNNVFEGSTDLPQEFQVKYLGSHDARGLWGIKHTRKPVDNMVASAKSLPTDTILPLGKLIVSEDGVSLVPLGKRKFDSGIWKTYPIETISYGVQDLVYTRVFSMIVVRDNSLFDRRVTPFECHAFVCESKHHARQLTYALATAFQIYSQNVKAQGKEVAESNSVEKKRFAIDLRSPEEIETDLTLDSEA